MMQYAYCTNITWDEDDNILIVHCASGYNNVVNTGKEGFTSVARPDIFTGEA